MTTRRHLVQTAAAVVAGALLPRLATGQGKSRLILLGTGGGPRPRKTTSAPAQVIVVNDTAYVVDCGDGVARQLVLAGVPLPQLRHIFLTHQHSDHNADYGNLLLLAWASGLRTRLDAWGPPPLEEITELFFAMSSYDIRTRIADEGRIPLQPLIHVHELVDGGLVLEDENVRVRATLVDHPPVVPAFGYRFDAPAGVKTLVLSHLVPAEDPEVTEQTWIDAAKMHFDGRIVVGRDLLEV